MVAFAADDDLIMAYWCVSAVGAGMFIDNPRACATGVSIRVEFYVDPRRFGFGRSSIVAGSNFPISAEDYRTHGANAPVWSIDGNSKGMRRHKGFRLAISNGGTAWGGAIPQ